MTCPYEEHIMQIRTILFSFVYQYLCFTDHH
jgi:hypothetical protein